MRQSRPASAVVIPVFAGTRGPFHLRLLGLPTAFPLCAGLLTLAPAGHTAETLVTNTPPAGLVLTTPMGTTVELSTNAMPAGALPPAKMGMDKQMPEVARGLPLPKAVRQRLATATAATNGWDWFPVVQPPMASYLASQDLYGNTALNPGSLLPASPLDLWPQQTKYAASAFGLRYSLAQSVTWVSLTDTLKGANTLGFYSLSFSGKWAVFSSAGGESAGWLSTEVKYQTGLGWPGQNERTQGNLGSASNPSSIWSTYDGVRMPELAWQQSFDSGRWVVIAGMVDQSNYLDANAYANSGRSQFLNSALINSMVVPLPDYNLGLNLQWQPTEGFYAMLGPSVGNGQPGTKPWLDFTWSNWSLTTEFGWTPTDFLGLGPGVYRLQPFVGQPAGGLAQVGLGLNFQQQLGHAERFGWFGRFGRGGRQAFRRDGTASNNASQVGTGLVIKGPLEWLGLFPDQTQDAAGLGFVWSQPTASSQPQHANEYVLEAGYRLQLTPTARLQTDLQIVWNPAYNPDPGPAVVTQLQLVFAW